MELIKYLTVYTMSMFKFIMGPVLGKFYGLPIPISILLTIGGMMTSVLLFTQFGEYLRPKFNLIFYRNKKKFSKRNRQFIKLWRRYGVLGVSILTPLIFTPIGGTILISIVGAKKYQIYSYMLFSASIWSIILNLATNAFWEFFRQTL